MQYMQDEHKMATDVRSATRPNHNAGDAQALEKSAATTPRPSDHLDPLPSASGSFSEPSVTGLYLRTNFIRPGESTVSMSSRASLIPSRALYSADLVNTSIPSENNPQSIQKRQQQGTDGETLRNHIPAPIKLIQTIDNTGRDGEYDPEGIQALLCTTPTMDKNVPDNSLPFVLQCYSQWAIVMIFEPLEMVHGIRERVIQRFSSEDTRIKAILMANIMRGFARNLVVDKKGASILRHLAVNLQKRGLYYTTKLNRPILDVDREGALCMLDYTFEVLTLQLHSQPTTIFIQSLDYVAAIFRCACPDLPGKPINLAALMLGSNTSLRWFACLDVLHSILSAKPTHFQYDVPFSIELCNQVQASASFQAVQGVPDQLIMFFAWVNSLCETPAGDSPEVIAWAEEILPQIRFAGGETGDALLRIGRMAIQECWRYAAYIYLYMALCGSNAHDPRVVRAQRGMIRVINGMKQGRNPDLFLAPMMIAGVVALKDTHRNIIRQRYLGVREFSERGTALNECILQLEDIWRRTSDEDRPAVWADLRIAFRRVTGK
ncbi:unnamed protein product [Rhizoctonia solani]|uniref:Fungal-specific transcription factor domain protein n=1 Tax=Rhizoctonia solani TaxID=456999 RepID=A0A8H3CGI3_9AGAM|nr:unnamed protein product [Rhizoctonia solani]